MIPDGGISRIRFGEKGQAENNMSKTAFKLNH
jgi:hypothetical protein